MEVNGAMNIRKNEDSQSTVTQSEGKQWKWTDDEEYSSELIQDHIFRCYDGEKR
jgi:hypothetical protein